MSSDTQYQLHHWWHWLAYGQNAAVVQALAAIVATCAAITAGYYAAKAYASTLKQLEIAQDQLRLAREQYENDLEHLLEEKRAAKRQALFTYQRTAAEEDSQRPRFAMTGSYMPNAGSQRLTFTNYAATSAADVQVYRALNEELLMEQGQINPNGGFGINIAPSELKTTGIRIKFRSTFGSLWEIVFRLDAPNQGETVEKVTRIYEPPGVE